jgi:hypothetical protein
MNVFISFIQIIPLFKPLIFLTKAGACQAIKKILTTTIYCVKNIHEAQHIEYPVGKVGDLRPKTLWKTCGFPGDIN